MKIIGDKIFALNAEGQLLSRVGTLFFNTPGLVTLPGMHAMQRLAWLDHLNAERASENKPPLTSEEEEHELTESVDLIFTGDAVLIRPNPDRMDLAFRADAELQKMVSKRVIRFLNTNSKKVRAALRERGENWRMARQPISPEDMAELIERCHVGIREKPIYYYNAMTGTRFLTASAFSELAHWPVEDMRRQAAEIVAGTNKRNRLGHLEVDVFPLSTPIAIRQSLQGLKVDALDDDALKEACGKIALEWRLSLPADLRSETPENFEWRNEMCHTLTRHPNETNAEEQELIAGISPEFYRQIEWLPGARIENDKVVFDEIYDEAKRTQDPRLLAMCDNRVKSYLFNTTRLYGKIAYINIGRITNTLSRKPVAGNRRGNVYVMQICAQGKTEPRVFMIRLQKWGVAEHLDEGKNLLSAMMEAEAYTDYILDRRLMCRELGMDLPERLSVGHFTETYLGDNQYRGISVRTTYFERAYVPGLASDKVPLAKYRNPAFVKKFADLMGAAAALDLIVGRRSSVTGELLFDQYYEVLEMSEDGLPERIRITDHAGSFTAYESSLEELAGGYADFVLRRRKYLSDFAGFAAAYLAGFERKLAEVQSSYREHRSAMNELFRDRPYDSNGSAGFRWAECLKRLDSCEPKKIAALLKSAIGC